MTEPLSENQQPLNQQALQALRTLRLTPDPDSLYSLQLMRWALINRKAGVLEEQRQDLLGAVDVLEGKPPAWAMQILARAVPNPRTMADLAPATMAAMIVLNLRVLLSDKT